MKKIVLTAAALAAVTLSSCGNRNQDISVKPDGSLDPCTLRFSWWGGDDRHEAALRALELWSERYPDITVIPEYGGWDGWTEKTAAQLSGGTAPDLMQINFDWLISMPKGGDAFYDLYSIPERIDISGYDSEVLSFGEMEGALRAVTISVSGRTLFYNSEVYDSLGAEYPETWDELIALGSSFSGKGAYPLDLDIQSGGTAWYLAVVYVQQTTGRQFMTMDGELGFSAEDIKLALDFYRRLEDERVIRTIQSRTDEDGNAALYQSPEFIDGTVAGVLEWGSSVGKYEMVLPEGVLEAGPLLTDGESTDGWMIKPSLMYAVSAQTQYPDEAAQLLDFFINDPDCAAIMGTTRGIPASSYAQAALEEKGLLTGLAMESDELLGGADTIMVSPYMELTRIKEYCNEAIEKVSYGQTDTGAAAEELYNSIQGYLEKIRK
ncbi:MAG: carbohydrate ABC transporter substrate-binding protein [Ruminococcus sp.]|nr:carbohydrate ABC transporter substrate-binding protein [Ruminococcus sp.]